LFSVEQNHTYDLSELGRYYKRYERLMAHWRTVLPESRFLDVSYEAVVADLEGQARRIIAHCGLPWDDRCLAFHKTERPVRTASAIQVRQPIYKTAVGHWRVYEQYLCPLLSALERDAQAKFSSLPK
jgi:DNA-binding IclR family transcriptional regulator